MSSFRTVKFHDQDGSALLASSFKACSGYHVEQFVPAVNQTGECNEVTTETIDRPHFRTFYFTRLQEHSVSLSSND